MTDNKDDFAPDERAFLAALKGRINELAADKTKVGEHYREMRDRTYREAQETRAQYKKPERKSFIQRLLG